MAIPSWYKTAPIPLTVDNLSGSGREIADHLGIEAALHLMDAFGGEVFYIPKLDCVLKEHRDANIRAEFNGYNIKQLARKYDATESWLHRLLHTEYTADKDKKPGKPCGGS